MGLDDHTSLWGIGSLLEVIHRACMELGYLVGSRVVVWGRRGRELGLVDTGLGWDDKELGLVDTGLEWVDKRLEWVDKGLGWDDKELG